MKKFVCYWGEGYDIKNQAFIRTSDFFSEEMGYYSEDIADIDALEVGQVWQTLVYPEGKQFVLRVE